MESLGKFFVEGNERQKAQEAAVVKIAAVLPPPEPTPAVKYQFNSSLT